MYIMFFKSGKNLTIFSVSWDLRGNFNVCNYMLMPFWFGVSCPLPLLF